MPAAPHWFPDLIDTLFEYMDRHAAKEREQLAQTEVSRKVFERLDFSLHAKTAVQIFGDASGIEIGQSWRLTGHASSSAAG